MHLTNEMIEFLEKRQFVQVGTADLKGSPTVAPKPILKAQSNCIYLADYLCGKTYNNLKENNQVCLSVLNINSVIGYVLHGVCKIIESDKEYKILLKELEEKQVCFAAQRIIQAVRGDRTNAGFEIASLKAVRFYKVILEEIVKVEPNGDLKKEKIAEADKKVIG